jgi:hypothetical protein
MSCAMLTKNLRLKLPKISYYLRQKMDRPDENPTGLFFYASIIRKRLKIDYDSKMEQTPPLLSCTLNMNPV